MTPPKLKKTLGVIIENLKHAEIPVAVIGALALGSYGLPRFTADIDLLTAGRFWGRVEPVMNRLGYTCFQKTESFAQFDSEMGIYGRADFMFVETGEGEALLGRRHDIRNELSGVTPVIQPTDYLILKMMAVANNPDRALQDEADIALLIDAMQKNALPAEFEPLNAGRLLRFADRFKMKDRVRAFLNASLADVEPESKFTL